MKKDKSKLKCFNCDNKGHFANECSESKKVNVQTTHICVTNVLSNVFLIESSPLWIVDLGATNHITKSRDFLWIFVQFLKRANGFMWAITRRLKFSK